MQRFVFLFRLLSGKRESILKTVSCTYQRGNNVLTKGTFTIIRIIIFLEVEISGYNSVPGLPNT
jgi:hypothetical protein